MTSPEGGFAGALPLVAPAVFLVRLQVHHHAELLHLALHAREHSVWGTGNGSSGFEGLDFSVLAVVFAAQVGAVVSGGAQNRTGTHGFTVFRRQIMGARGRTCGWKLERLECEGACGWGKKEAKRKIKGINEQAPTL